ncbi:transcriptional regulator [Bacillus sp. J14TS2]|uniref:LCP family protein n=1 Tax=Bacillus sp. J14TS2 TaxID=2807188 RepID=UPI001B1E5919|nr:LCP family protein [Bacillus sp. J14TS2]GIN73935.1 transcriptional regulator [Bacillus sp. J14TS2]
MKKSTLFVLIISSFLLLFGCQNIGKDHSEQEETENEVVDESINFLVLGIDSRGEANSRTDTIMLVNYRPEDRTLKLISIMRDSYVQIPGHKYNFDKINNAYFLGGEELLKKTIQNNFGLDVDHTVTVDFQGFVSVMDTLIPEGINVHVDQAVIDDMDLKMAAGENSLHGEDLLKYVRFRHDERSDFGRVERQQEILLDVIAKVNEKMNSFTGMTKIPQLVHDTIKNVETDLGPQEIITLSSMVFSQPIEQIETMRIPVKDGFTNQTYGHAGAVLKLDFLKNQEAMQKFLSEPTPVNDEP